MNGQVKKNLRSPVPVRMCAYLTSCIFLILYFCVLTIALFIGICAPDSHTLRITLLLDIYLEIGLTFDTVCSVYDPVFGILILVTELCLLLTLHYICWFLPAALQ